MPPWQFIEGVQGTNIANVVIPTAKITKTGGVDAVFDAGAASNQKIAGDGFIECSPTGLFSYRAIGFSVDNPGLSRDEIDYAIYFRNDASAVSFLENGAALASMNVAYAITDVFRLERVGATVRAYKNGELVFTYPTASAGSLLIDTSFFNTNSEVGGIRLYDATSKSWIGLTWQGVTNVTVAAGTSTTRRLTFTAPLKMRTGDQLVAILASQGTEFVSAQSSTWEFVNAFTSATNKRGCAIYRRTVTDSEPSSYTFDLNVTQETLGALLVYRGLDNGAQLVGGSGIDTVALTVHPCPSRTLTRYSDLYLGVVFMLPAFPDLSGPPDATTRLNFVDVPSGLFVTRLLVFDFAAEAVGATDTKRTTTVAPRSCAAFAVALQGLPALGQGLSWTPIVPGSIGLPVEGI